MKSDLPPGGLLPLHHEAAVEHAFLIVKRDFGYRKVAYRGIAKNMNRFHVLFGCANLLMCIRAGRTEQFRNKQVAPIVG